MKMTRKAIKEGLDQFPIDGVVLGAVGAKESRLTPKQREFARQVALGESKAGAYRKAYNSKGKPETQSRRGVELTKDGKISAQIEAFKLAIEAEKSRTPAHLRAFVIHKLTEKALDASVPPAQQIKALELLGKITEVAAFTERREVVQVKDSGEIRARLMDSIRAAMQAGAQDVEVIEADDLLAEISGGRDPDDGGEGVAKAQEATPPEATPPKLNDSPPQTVHSIPHTQSAEIDSPTEITNVQEPETK